MYVVTEAEEPLLLLALCVEDDDRTLELENRVVEVEDRIDVISEVVAAVEAVEAVVGTDELDVAIFGTHCTRPPTTTVTSR